MPVGATRSATMVPVPERIEERVDGPSADPTRVPMDAYDYGLPESAIAQRPVEPRSAARLLIGPGLDGNEAAEHATMAELPRLLRPGDVVVVNDTRVLPARLLLTKESGGRAEVLLLEPTDPASGDWEALVRPGRRLPDPTPLYEPGDRGGPVVVVGRAGGIRDGRPPPGPVARPLGGRTLGIHAPASLHPPPARRSRAVPDGVLGAPGPGGPLDRRAHRRTPLHPGAARGVPGRRGHRGPGGAGHRPRHLPAHHRRRRPTSTSSTPSATRSRRRPWTPRRGRDRVVAVGTTAVRALESGRRRGAGRPHRPLHPRGVPVPAWWMCW